VILVAAALLLGTVGIAIHAYLESLREARAAIAQAKGETNGENARHD
jgi:hypothetical protein